MVHAFVKFVTIDEGGQGLVEYALILSLVALVAIIALKTFGTAIGTSLTNSSTKIP